MKNCIPSKATLKQGQQTCQALVDVTKVRKRGNHSRQATVFNITTVIIKKLNDTVIAKNNYPIHTRRNIQKGHKGDLI